jgi:predicted 3-demethylubiquinone-9 3-methyltransferase (glyoxalase superfamily)
VSVFRNSRIGRIYRHGDADPGAKCSVMTVEIELDGRHFVGLNGGPQYQFTPAISSPQGPRKSQAAMRAMFGMKKFDIAVLQETCDPASSFC